MSRIGSTIARAALICISALVASIAVAAPANAAPAVEACVLNADTGAYSCSTTEASALSKTTAATPQAAAVTYYTIGRFYDGANYTGSSLTIVSNYSTGCVGRSYHNDMPSGWNDRVSSWHGYLSCHFRMFQNIGLGGATYGPYADVAVMSSLDNQASSWSAL